MSTAASSVGAGGALEQEDVNVNGGNSTTLASEGTTSPRVSTQGDDDQASKKERQMYTSVGADYTAPGLDSLHWAGVKKRGTSDYDQRSIASSMNAEKDDKSIYEEHAVGAVEEAEEESDEDAPEEIVLGQVRSELATTSLSSGSRTLSKHGSGVDAPAAGSPRPALRQGPASVALSTDADNGSLRPTSEDGEVALEDVALEGEGVRPAARAASSPRDIAGATPPRANGAPPPLGASIAASSVAASPRSPGLPPSPLFGRSVDSDGVNETAALPSARPASKDVPGGGAGVNGGAHGPPYQSRLMQELTGSGEGAGGDEEVERPHSAAGAAAPQAASASVQPGALRNSPPHETPPAAEAAAEARAGPPAAAAAAPAMQPLQVESGPAVAPPAPPLPAPRRVDLGPEWESTFKGLLYTDGVDAMGRPVAVLNADAVPPRMKASALTYVKAHLEPVVNAGQYVIVFTARRATLPTFWIMGAYQSLPRPYRKNVQYIVLVRPSAFLRAVLAFMRPFVSRKAGRKIKVVESLEELSEATGGEVGVPHLGRSFLDDDAAAQEAEAVAAAAQGP